jgi:hypothetical protein
MTIVVVQSVSRPRAIMNAALIFCERTGAWCVALRRLLDEYESEIVETRSLAECREELLRRPASMLVLEATADSLAQVLSWLARLERDFPQARAAVVAERSLAQYEWAVREAGALAMSTSPRNLEPLVSLARSFLSMRQIAEPTMTERVWNSLPWKPLAASANAAGNDTQ